MATVQGAAQFTPSQRKRLLAHLDEIGGRRSCVMLSKRRLRVAAPRSRKRGADAGSCGHGSRGTVSIATVELAGMLGRCAACSRSGHSLRLPSTQTADRSTVAAIRRAEPSRSHLRGFAAFARGL